MVYVLFPVLWGITLQVHGSDVQGFKLLCSETWSESSPFTLLVSLPNWDVFSGSSKISPSAGKSKSEKLNFAL